METNKEERERLIQQYKSDLKWYAMKIAETRLQIKLLKGKPKNNEN